MWQVTKNGFRLYYAMENQLRPVNCLDNYLDIFENNSVVSKSAGTDLAAS